MACKYDFSDNVVSMDAELLDDVEPPNLISLSDSQVSGRDFQSDCESSDTFDVSSSSVNKAKGRVCFPEHKCLFEKEHRSVDYKNDSNLRPFMDSFNSKFKCKKNNDVGIFCSLLKDRATKSVSSLNLITYGKDSICEVNKLHCSIDRYGRSGTNLSKRCRSLPNLNFTPKCEMTDALHNFLQNIPHDYKTSKDSFMKIALHFIKAFSFADFLIKILLERLHSAQFAMEEKDVLISELMHSYDKLIIRHAEAENKIDRMRFENLISEGMMSVSTSNIDISKQTAFNADSVHENIECDIPNAGLDKTNEELKVEKLIFSAENSPRGLRKSEPHKNEHHNRQKRLIRGSIGLDIKTSGKEISDTEAFKDEICLQSDSNFHECELDNKINLEKLEKEILLHGCLTHHKNDIFSDSDSISNSEDELSLKIPGNHANSIHSEKSLKNNFNNSYNKVITYAKAKRDLSSHPDFHNLIYEKNECDSYESLPNLNTSAQAQETFIKSSDKSSTILLPEINSAEDTLNLTNGNIGITSSKLGCVVMENIVTVEIQALSDNENSCLTGTNHFPEKSSALLNNILDQERNNREDKVMPKYFYCRNPDSNFKKSVFDFKETNPIDNRIQMVVKNYFERTSGDPLCKVDSNFSEVEEESESSASLGSVKLEACDCWNEQLSSQIVRSIGRETHSIGSKISISPLQLGISSSDDYSLPILGIDNQECDETLKSLDDAAIDDGKMKGFSLLQMKTKRGRVPLGDKSRKIAKSVQSAVLSGHCQKKIFQILNSLDKIDAAASELKCKTERLKKNLALELDGIS